MADQPITTPNTSGPTTPPPSTSGTTGTPTSTPTTTTTPTNSSVFPSTYLGNNTSNYDIKSYLDNLTNLYNSYNTNYGNLSNAYTSALTPSAEETALTNDINNLNASERQGLANTENKVIPMEFIVGQQAQIQKQAALDRLSKSESLQALTGQRLGRLDALKAQLGFEDNRFEKLLGLQKEFNDISKSQRDEARTTLGDIINYSQGKSFDELDPESQQAIINSTANSPLSLGLVKQGMERAKLAFQDEQTKNRAGMTDTVKLDNGQTVLIDKSTGKVIKNLGGGSDTGIGGGGNSLLNPQYEKALSVILGSSKFTKENKADVINAIRSGQDPITVIKNKAKDILGATEGTKLTNYETANKQLDDVKNLLNQYYQAGGKTNVFKGNFEKTLNKLGTLKDPKLVSIATQIASALQIYRNAVSGTAYSVQEGQQIASVFPGINKTQGLNDAILSGRKQSFNSLIDGMYTSALGGSYNDLKGGSNDPLGLGI